MYWFPPSWGTMWAGLGDRQPPMHLDDMHRCMYTSPSGVTALPHQECILTFPIHPFHWPSYIHEGTISPTWGLPGLSALMLFPSPPRQESPSQGVPAVSGMQLSYPTPRTPGQAGPQSEMSSWWEHLRAAVIIKDSCSQVALYVFPPFTSWWCCGRIPSEWSEESSAPVWIGICRGTSSPRRWHHCNEQTLAIRHLFFRFMSWGWLHGKGKTQLTRQGLAPQGAWMGNMTRYVCCFKSSSANQELVCVIRVALGNHSQHASGSRLGFHTHRLSLTNPVPCFHTYCFLGWQVGSWHDGFVQSMSVFPDPKQNANFWVLEA